MKKKTEEEMRAEEKTRITIKEAKRTKLQFWYFHTIEMQGQYCRRKNLQYKSKSKVFRNTQP